jgi:hypothetical protein
LLGSSAIQEEDQNHMATKTVPAPQQFLVVADCGPNTDYTTEPRHRVELLLPFTPCRRSSAKQLQQVFRRVRWQVSEFLPPCPITDPASSDEADQLHVWLCDESGQPVLFVSGLLAVREGRATKTEAEALHRRLLPQVTGGQEVRDFRACVSASVQKWCDYDGPVGDDNERHEREGELLDELEGVFQRFWLGDSEEDEHGLFYVCAEGWMLVTVQLPFVPGQKSTAAQLRFASVLAQAEVLCVLPEDWEIDHDNGEGEVWLLDEQHQPTQYISGLLDVREGRLSARKLKGATERAKESLGSWMGQLLEAA